MYKGISPRLHKLPLRWKLIASCVGLVIVLCMAMAIITLFCFHVHQRKQMKQFGTVILDNMVKSSRHYLAAYDYHGLRSILREPHQIAELAYVAIYDDTGRLIAYSPSYDSPHYEQIEKYRSLPKEQTLHLRSLVVPNDQLLTLSRNVYHNGSAAPVGMVQIALSEEQTFRPLNRVLQYVSIWGGFLIAVLAAVLGWILTRFARPLIELANYCRNSKLLSPDKLLVVQTSTPEITTIVDSFSSMTHRIVDQELLLAAQQNQLKIGQIATQVAHDIRSPLAALEVATAGLAELPEEKRLLVRRATARNKIGPRSQRPPGRKRQHHGPRKKTPRSNCSPASLIPW